jgi:mono/diheme cytochrome c family protein
MRSWITGLSIAFATSSAFAMGNVTADNAQRIEAGRQIYTAQCAACHGARAEGQPDWDRLDQAGELPAPPHDETGHTWKHSDAMLYRLIRSGWRDPFNKTSRLTMPAFGGSLSPEQTRDVIEYLKTLWSPTQRAFQLEESQKSPFPPEAQ